ncbi:MAG: thiamine pyrophosphate-dependent dehydrogenase E1 component subunit alpha [Anaerolineae bacterium]|nr:thiamine pyrophosphate-dependent dehydrogenase E1 component subunit alpha [Anaerolineae bacterium]MDW8172369.1 thiamine pyrophosphate-dependent dehydrogenase E1 component subunit alpha [Anaerolineae bacterium]
MVQDAQAILKLYRDMLIIRRAEERILEELMQGKLASTMCHVSIGQEAVAVGVCSVMAEQDYLTSTHRGHGHFLARGGDVKRMMAELFGKETGYCRGRGGSMHITDAKIGHLGANGIVGGHIGIAVGAALWSKMSRRPAVTVCFFGDGGLTQGIFHEAANMASVWKLPVVFVCENNQYAMSLPWNKAAGQTSIQAYASSYAMPGLDVDGQDVLAVQQAAYEAIERARGGGGPSLIGAYTYRFLGHSRGDPSKYRDPEEEKRERARDPLLILRSKYPDVLDDRTTAQAETEVKAMMDDAVAFAEASPIAGASAVFSEIYA